MKTPTRRVARGGEPGRPGRGVGDRLKREGLARRLEAARPAPPPTLDLSWCTDEEIAFLADLGERRQTADGRWDVTAMTPDERLAVEAVLARAGVP